METKKSKTYEINDLIQWYENQELNISPKYQRNPVWDNSAKSFLIDTILRNYPMPPIFIRQTFNLSERKTKREVIDGQQRSRAILGFYNNEFPVLKKHNNEYGGCFYKDLDDQAKENFLCYNFFVDTITETDDSIIYDIFARMNSNAANVNKQEVRNAKYWGDFKTSVYTVSSKIRDFFIEYNVFTAKQLSRMKDMEYVSTLFILAIEGCTNDTPSKTDKYYNDYDKDFNDAQVIENYLLDAFSIIDKVFQCANEFNTIWKNPNYLFDLIGVIFVAKNVITLNSDIKQGSLVGYSEFANILLEIHYELEDFKRNREASSEIIEYEKNHRQHTTGKLEREARILFLIKRGLIR